MNDTAVGAGDQHDPVGTWLKWILLFVAVGGFTVIGFGTARTYHLAPPVPQKIVAASGATLMTEADLVAGKAGFQRADLMDYGSLYGMGSYFGEDYTAEYLVRLGQLTADNLARARFGTAYSALAEDDQAAVRREMQKSLQGIDLSRNTTVVPAAVAGAITGLRADISQRLLTNNFEKGWTKAYSLDKTSAAQTADFLIFSSLTTVARRPGRSFSWTNNWPYEPFVGNTPTASTFQWTWISFMIVFFLFGAVLFLYERFINEPDVAPRERIFTTFNPLTPSQRAIGKYFVVVAAVLLVQITAGAMLAHYYSERASFYGIRVDALLPFAFLRDVHIQSPIVWIGLSWIGAALFLAPMISGREARGQGKLTTFLFWVTVAIVAGALAGDYLGIMGWIGKGWFWFGNQGLSYIQLGRFWQIGFFVGLALWSLMVMRGLWPSRETFAHAARAFWSGRIKLEHLFWASTINIAVLYWFGMIPLTGIEKSFTITDFWRWWVVHLWVEQSFEFFAACITAYLLMALGLVSRRLAERTVLLEVILIFLGGVIGTGHHWYWTGTPGMWVPLGSVFSFLEVLPLVLLIIEAIQQRKLIKGEREFRYGLAYTYIIGAAVWNFVGAGVFGGGTINAPLVNYYEHATFLTLNHAHTALFGAFGLLAIGVVYFCLRYAAGDRHAWTDKIGLWAFWLYNLGLVLWIALNFFPIGWPQLQAVYEHGLAYARSQEFYKTTLLWQWLRFPGDVVFALAALLMAFDFLIKLRPFLPRLARARPSGETVAGGIARGPDSFG